MGVTTYSAVSGQDGHSSRPVITDPGSPIGRLNQEWAWLRATPRVLARLRSWAGADPALRGLGTADALEAAVAGADRERVDAILYALLCRGQGECAADRDVAARVVVQLMLPRAARLARCGLSRQYGVVLSRVDRQALAVSCLYEAVRRYPLRRVTRVAANLAMETFSAVHRVLRAEAPSGCAPPDDERQPAAVLELNPGEELVLLLRWAVSEGVLSRPDAGLLARRYLSSDGVGRRSWRGMADPVELGAELGVGAEAVRQRCCRAVRVLREALVDGGGALLGS